MSSASKVDSISSQNETLAQPHSSDQTLSVDPGLQKDLSHNSKEMITANFPEKRPRGNPNDDDQSSAKHLRGRNSLSDEGGTTLITIINMDRAQISSSSLITRAATTVTCTMWLTIPPVALRLLSSTQATASMR